MFWSAGDKFSELPPHFSCLLAGMTVEGECRAGALVLLDLFFSSKMIETFSHPLDDGGFGKPFEVCDAFLVEFEAREDGAHDTHILLASAMDAILMAGL